MAAPGGPAAEAAHAAAAEVPAEILRQLGPVLSGTGLDAALSPDDDS